MKKISKKRRLKSKSIRVKKKSKGKINLKQINHE